MVDDRWPVDAFGRGPNHGRSEGLPEYLSCMPRPEDLEGQPGDE